jgi:hypothetical protein
MSKTQVKSLLGGTETETGSLISTLVTKIRMLLGSTEHSPFTTVVDIPLSDVSLPTFDVSTLSSIAGVSIIHGFHQGERAISSSHFLRDNAEIEVVMMIIEIKEGIFIKQRIQGTWYRISLLKYPHFKDSIEEDSRDIDIHTPLNVALLVVVPSHGNDILSMDITPGETDMGDHMEALDITSEGGGGHSPMEVEVPDAPSVRNVEECVISIKKKIRDILEVIQSCGMKLDEKDNLDIATLIEIVNGTVTLADHTSTIMSMLISLENKVLACMYISLQFPIAWYN